MQTCDVNIRVFPHRSYSQLRCAQEFTCTCCCAWTFLPPRVWNWHSETTLAFPSFLKRAKYTVHSIHMHVLLRMDFFTPACLKLTFRDYIGFSFISEEGEIYGTFNSHARVVAHGHFYPRVFEIDIQRLHWLFLHFCRGRNIRYIQCTCTCCCAWTFLPPHVYNWHSGTTLAFPSFL